MSAVFEDNPGKPELASETDKQGDLVGTQRSDEDEIRNLLYTYAHLVDHGRWSEVPERIYTEDAIDDHGMGEMRGREELKKFFCPENLGAFMEGTAHFFTNIIVTVDGDDARSQAYATAWHWLQSTKHLGALRPADVVAAVLADDTWVRTPDGWRISERYVRRIGPGALCAGTASATSLGDMLAGYDKKLGPESGLPMLA